MPPEITAQNLQMPADSGQMSAARHEGNKMDTCLSRRLPVELFAAIADQVSILISLWVEPDWMKTF